VWYETYRGLWKYQIEETTLDWGGSKGIWKHFPQRVALKLKPRVEWILTGWKVKDGPFKQREPMKKSEDKKKKKKILW